MREQPHYSSLLTEEFFRKHYVEERKSFPQLREMLLAEGHNIHVGTLYAYAKRLGFGRSRSESRRNIDPNPLDWSISLLDAATVEAIDGFLLGDGNISSNENQTAGRLQCGVEHEVFCQYLMSFFVQYRGWVKQYKSSHMKSGWVWDGKTKFHPDLNLQYQRWYPEVNGKRVKVPPADVRITPKSVMMWYLGDGSVVQNGNSIALRLSTDGFDHASVDRLVQRLIPLGILCHRSGDNRIYIEARGIPAFFDFIGRESPVACYRYKFELPEWRFESRRMRDVADELGITYNHLSYLVKNGKVGCIRASDKGRPRLLPEHIEQAKIICHNSCRS